MEQERTLFVPLAKRNKNVLNAKNILAMLENEFNYFIANQDELAAKFNGRYIVIQ